jgi:primosomal replication protein N
MSMPPIYHYQDLGNQAQLMARNCNNERLAMIMQSVAVGSMILMTGFMATQLLREVFSPVGDHRGRSR